MKKRFSPLIVGAFVLGGLLLAAFALVSFGARRFFSDPYRFVVMIDDSSVSGLDVGSAVKLSGVRVGRVESVSASFDRVAGAVAIRVECDFDEVAAASMLGDNAQTPTDLVRELILGGLHAKLKFSGITGLLYLDLEILPPAATSPSEITYEKLTGYPIVPMAPSLLAKFTDSISSITTGLASVDFAGISTELKSVLASLNRALAGVELQQTTGRIEAAATAVTTLADNPDLRASMATLNASLQEVQALMSTWREASPGLRDNLTATINAATSTLTEFERTAGAGTALLESRRELPHELIATLTSLQQAADAIQRLADYLERNPGALLRGRATESPRASQP